MLNTYALIKELIKELIVMNVQRILQNENNGGMESRENN